MPTAEEIQALKGRRVTFELDAGSPAGPLVTGLVAGTLPAADGLVVSVAPDGEPDRRITFNYQHIRAYRPA